MTGQKATGSPCGGVAAAGLVSFSNKEEIPAGISPTNAKDIAAFVRRQARMQAGVIGAAKYINNVLIGDDDSWRSAMVTVTYRPGCVWEPAHIRTLLAHYRKWFKRRSVPFRAVWKLETTEAGVPHYHILLWIKKGKALRPPLPDKQGWWPHGMTQAVFVKSSAVGYIAKYCSKKSGSRLPKGARIWGHSGLDEAGKYELARKLAPRWLKALVSVEAQLKRVQVVVEEARKYGRIAMVTVRGFLDKYTGLIFLSPWVFEGFTGQNGLALRHQGYVEAWSNDGDYFRIPQAKGVFA